MTYCPALLADPPQPGPFFLDFPEQFIAEAGSLKSACRLSFGTKWLQLEHFTDTTTDNHYRRISDFEPVLGMGQVQ